MNTLNTQYHSCVIWLTGLSGSGKSTIAEALSAILSKKGIHAYTLDGDKVRSGLNTDLGFSVEDRFENNRRVAEVAKLMMDAGMVVIATFISPTQKMRDEVAKIIGSNYYEVFVSTPLEECIKRDVKGLYARAKNGEIENMTGISAPYEPPLHPFMEIDTTNESVAHSAEKLYNYLIEKNILTNE